MNAAGRLLTLLLALACALAALYSGSMLPIAVSESGAPTARSTLDESTLPNDTLELLEQLHALESSLPRELTDNFRFQSELNRSTEVRPHLLTYGEAAVLWGTPVRPSCPSSHRPDMFCAPNVGRDWPPSAVVHPISYALPEEFFTANIPTKDKDCSFIVPRDRATYKFATEQEYMQEYARSYYCITYKKGGWDVMRHYEIIAAGCMPYMVDVEYAPVYSLFHMPKRLLLEARSLAGVRFNCSSVRVEIDHAVFPHKKYFELLEQLLIHARKHLTTTAMARYVLDRMGVPNASSVLYFARAAKGVAERAQGNYNSWTLFHGCRQLLGKNCVDAYEIPFLYASNDTSRAASTKRKLYGLGFGYAFRLPKITIDRSTIVHDITAKKFDVVIFADPTSMVNRHTGEVKFLRLVEKFYPKSSIAFLHAPDIAYPLPKQLGYDIRTLYERGVVFQREIADCQYYVPVDRKSEAMKRCVWYHNRNCFDDVNVASTASVKGERQYMKQLREGVPLSQ